MTQCDARPTVTFPRSDRVRAGPLRTLPLFKLAVTVHRCLNGRAPSYLSEHCIPVSSADTRRHLRSANRHLLSGSTLTAVGRSQLLARWPGTHSRILSEIQRAAQTVLCIYLKRTCSRVTSASSALGVRNDYALYKSTHSLTHSLTDRNVAQCGLPCTPIYNIDVRFSLNRATTFTLGKLSTHTHTHAYVPSSPSSIISAVDLCLGLAEMLLLASLLDCHSTRHIMTPDHFPCLPLDPTRLLLAVCLV